MIKRIIVKVILPVLIAISLPVNAVFAQETDVSVQEMDEKRERKIDVVDQITEEYSKTFSLDVRLLDMSDETHPEGVLIEDENDN